MTDRTHDLATLITQLRVVANLTRTEAQVARLRLSQATGDEVRDELRGNAADAEARVVRIAAALRELGALPDPVTPVLGRVAALVRGALEQAQPLDEALLGDLALEHQLRDRARYVAALADAADRPQVRALADDLAAAHTETIDWLTGVLADLGAGRPAAFDASLLQRVAAQVTHAANAPARSALDPVGAGVAGAVHTAGVVVSTAGGTAAGALGKAAAATGDAAGAVIHTAPGAVQEAAAHDTDTDTDTDTNTGAGADADTAAADRAVSGTADTDTGAEPDTEPDTEPTDTEPTDTEPEAPSLASTGPAAPPTAEDLPVPGFAELPTHAAVAALRTLDDPRDVAAVLAFERAHGDRPAVVAAAGLRADALSG